MGGNCALRAEIPVGGGAYETAESFVVSSVADANGMNISTVALLGQVEMADPLTDASITEKTAESRGRDCMVDVDNGSCLFALMASLRAPEHGCGALFEVVEARRLRKEGCNSSS